MSDFIIKIHGITNEMVADAPDMSEKIQDIAAFLDDGIPMAHHAPFDLGFMAFEFEKHGLRFPKSKVLCTSLLSRKVITDSVNHKLQTLIGHLKIQKGTAHRALDDSEACLQVGLHCLNKINAEKNLTKDLFDDQQIETVMQTYQCGFQWKDFSILSATDKNVLVLKQAIEEHKSVDMIYEGGSQLKNLRRISPIGIVRTPEGDFVQAKCHRDNSFKRFYISKMKDLQLSLL